MLLDLTPDTANQTELALEPDTTPDRSRLMSTMDALNMRFGKDTLHVASTGQDGPTRVWGMRQERRSPHYTTVWAEALSVKA